MIDLVDDILCWTVLPVVVGLYSYQLGVLRTALIFLPHLPKEFSHRSWGLRIFRREGLIELEVGGIGWVSGRVRRP